MANGTEVADPEGDAEHASASISSTLAPTRVDRGGSVAGTDTKSKRRNYLRDGLLGLVVLAVFGLGIGVYYTERFEIRSASMAPALEVGDTVWAVRLMQPPTRGDLVAFESPMGGGEMLIKRVVGLPGETVEAIDGVVFVNRGSLNESIWIDEPQFTNSFGPVPLGADEYFLLGDNRSQSTDSRTFGPVLVGDISYQLVD